MDNNQNIFWIIAICTGTIFINVALTFGVLKLLGLIFKFDVNWQLVVAVSSIVTLIQSLFIGSNFKIKR